MRLPLHLSLLALLLATPVAAHDFWIEPSSFRPEPGSVVEIHLRVGEHFVGDAVGRNPELIERFALVTAAGETVIPGREGEDPAGAVRVDAPGVVVYRSRGSVLELDRVKLERFTSEEGVEWLLRERAKRGESDAPWRESFSRCAKALIGAEAAPIFTKPHGLRLELIPETAPSKRLPVRLEFEGRPLAGALVVAINATDPAQRIERRSDKRGRVVLPLLREGTWLVKAVHVVRAPAGGKADWDSLWASLTFALR